ncbi:glycosyltransferase [uncultured Helicobacter sp.]|uniref:glycosyltransferase n=1 Tax=uncultured Helicobacter sp. TaxID=175537 RepID=UPI003750ED34
MPPPPRVVLDTSLDIRHCLDSQTHRGLESSFSNLDLNLESSPIVLESNEDLESSFKVSDSQSNQDSQKQNLESNPIDLESKQLTQSTTLKNPSETLLNTNSACGSTSRAESKNLDSAIFAEQKSNQCGGAIAPTDTRPCRGGKNQEQGGSSATADFSKETSFCLDKETARHSPRLRKKTQRVASKAQQKRGALSFSGLGRAGRGETPFSFAQTQDSKKLENIRENASLRNLESIESSVEILGSTQLTESSLADSESKTFTESSSMDSKTITESSPIDSEISTESKEILKNEQRQNLSQKESTQSQTNPQTHNFDLNKIDSKAHTESSVDSKTITESTRANVESTRFKVDSQSKTRTESNTEIRRNARLTDSQKQNLHNTETTQPTTDSIPRFMAPHIVAIRLSTNKGHQNALLAGLEYASKRCDCAISIDCDLQDDEQKFDEFMQHYKSGADIVMGIRNDRDTDTALKKYTALGFYKLMHFMGVKIIYNHADYRLLSRRAIESLMEFKEVNLFLRGIVPLLGFKHDMVYYDRLSREFGQSKYPLRKMLSFAWNGITSFSIMPLRLVSVLGFVFFLLSLGLGGYALYVKVFTDNALWGWASTIIPFSFLVGFSC